MQVSSVELMPSNRVYHCIVQKIYSLYLIWLDKSSKRFIWLLKPFARVESLSRSLAVSESINATNESDIGLRVRCANSRSNSIQWLSIGFKWFAIHSKSIQSICSLRVIRARMGRERVAAKRLGLLKVISIYVKLLIMIDRQSVINHRY